MDTIKTIKRSLKAEALGEIISVLRTGGIVVIPTANTYGLLANGQNEEAVNQIYALKARDTGKPLGYLASRRKAAEYGVLGAAERNLISMWPCPLSIIIPKAKSVPAYITAGFPSVLLVCPDMLSESLVDAADFPIACTSANLSSQPAITEFHEAVSFFDGKVSLILDGGTSLHGQNGTIIDCSKTPPVVLRLGPYPIDELRKRIPNFKLAVQTNTT